MAFLAAHALTLAEAVHLAQRLGQDDRAVIAMFSERSQGRKRAAAQVGASMNSSGTPELSLPSIRMSSGMYATS